MIDQDDIKKLIKNYNRRLQKLRERQALEGITTDPKILIEIEDIERSIRKLQKELNEIEQSSSSQVMIGTLDKVSEKDSTDGQDKKSEDVPPTVNTIKHERVNKQTNKVIKEDLGQVSPPKTRLSNAYNTAEINYFEFPPIEGKSINLRNFRQIAEVGTLIGHIGKVYDIQFSADGLLLASASEDRTTRLWDVAKRIQAARLTGANSAVRSVALSPNDGLLVSGSDDRLVQLWGMPFGGASKIWLKHSKKGEDNPIADFQRIKFSPQKYPKGAIFDLAFNPSGKFLAVGSQDRTVRVYRVSYGYADTFFGMLDRMQGQEEIPSEQILSAHAASVNAVAFSPDGSILDSGKNGNYVNIR